MKEEKSNNVQPRFSLKRPESKTPTAVILRLKWSGQEMNFGTGVSVLPSLWDKDSQRPISTISREARKVIEPYTKKDPNIYANLESKTNRLNTIEKNVSKYFSHLNEPPNATDARTAILAILKPSDHTGDTITLTQYVDLYIHEITSGKRLTVAGTKYAPATVKAFNSFKVRFSDFQTWKHKVYDFEDIDLSFYDDFVSYLTKQLGNRPNSTGKQIKCLKAILRAALDLKIHSNRTFQLRKFKATTLDDVEAVSLSVEEVSRMAALDLTNNEKLGIARDVFLIGVWTAQRFSDYSRINPDNFVRGLLRITQQKTDTKVIIPISQELNELLRKHGNTVPFIWEQDLNERIKIVASMADIKDPVQRTEFIKGQKIVKTYKKCELISTHTARRTGATLMYKAGVLVKDIQRITGHKSLKQLEQYIRISPEETAERLAIHPYFSPLRLVK